jgi:hypothetical protein
MTRESVVECGCPLPLWPRAEIGKKVYGLRRNARFHPLCFRYWRSHLLSAAFIFLRAAGV